MSTSGRQGLDHMIIFREAHLRRILGRYAAYYNDTRIARWTRMPHSTGRLSASVSSHHSLSSAAFITNIAESDFRHAHASPGTQPTPPAPPRPEEGAAIGDITRIDPSASSPNAEARAP